MNIAEKIYKEASKLPEYLAKEMLDFIEFIKKTRPSGQGNTESKRRPAPGNGKYLG